LNTRVKKMIKGIITQVSLFEEILIFVYKTFGRRPWSLGYSIYKDRMIQDVLENQLTVFDADTLPSNYGFGIDERIVEYPWVFSRLKSDERKILDAGSALNHANILSINLLKDCKLYISTLSYEGFVNTGNAPSYIFEDLRETCYKDEFFDAVACISTLEHVGMDNTLFYTSNQKKNENEKYAFLGAIKELRRVLKKGGALYLTVPYGKYKNHRWFQVFDHVMIDAIKKEFSPSYFSETYFKYEGKQWNFSSKQACRDSIYFDIHHEKGYREDYLAASQSVACLGLVK